jgi:hypothetical protein
MSKEGVGSVVPPCDHSNSGEAHVAQLKNPIEVVPSLAVFSAPFCLAVRLANQPSRPTIRTSSFWENPGPKKYRGIVIACDWAISGADDIPIWCVSPSNP